MDGYVGYMKPYATSHESLDENESFQAEVKNVARTLGAAVMLSTSGKLANPGEGLVEPTPK
jgi:hypothetical protein